MVGPTSRGASGPLYFIHRAWFPDEKYHPLSRDDPIDTLNTPLRTLQPIPYYLSITVKAAAYVTVQQVATRLQAV